MKALLLKIKTYLKQKKKWFLFSVSALVCLLVFAYINISLQTKKHLFSDVSTLPYNKVGLVLGTSKYIKGGSKNLYFSNRMLAAATLYHKGKVSYLIVSGDNRTMQYNEPANMRKELLKLGVPDSVIILDYAGFRTLDSVVRCKEIFGQQSYTIISQKFHNQRAVYLARQHNIEAIAFNAKEVTGAQALRTSLREVFARVKVYIDLMLEKEPKFLGEKIDLP